MASTDKTRLVVLAVLLLGVAALNGCVFVEAHFTVNADDSVDALMEIGMLKAALEGEGAEADMNVTDGLTEGQWEEPVEFERGEWQVTAMKGHAEAGESLFTEDTPDVPRFGSETHLLTTVYSFNMSFETQEPTVEPIADADDADAQGDDEDAGDFEGLDEMFSDLATVMAGQGETFHFACTLPGEIATSNGDLAGADTVAWGLSLSGEGMPEEDEMQATSRLINWEVVGAVGFSLVEMGRDDLVLPLVSGAQRGIIPDPVTDNPLGGEIDLPLYVQILDIMVALDELVGEDLTDQVMVALGLNADEPDAEAVAYIAAKVAAEDFAEGVSKAASDNVVWKLLGP